MNEKEYGGYIELDTYHGREYYPKLLALNSGRTALQFLIRYRKIKKLLLPRLCCSTVWEACEKEGAAWETYPVDIHFQPVPDRPLFEGEWLYLVNFYGALPNELLRRYAQAYPRLIVDDVHAFFQAPLSPHAIHSPDMPMDSGERSSYTADAYGPAATVDTIYSCRKFFGVPDGAYLSLWDPKTKKEPDQGPDLDWQALYDRLPQDVSRHRMGYLLGRFEGRAADHYHEYTQNDLLFTEEPVKQMSRLTHNLLRGIDYAFVLERRSENFRYLHARLKGLNRLKLPIISGAYAYPFWTKGSAPSGPQIRKKLLDKKIYIPTLWPEMLKPGQEGTLGYQMAENILPLPVDQRYTREDMDVICGALLDALL